jgi:hypothetical protein
MRLASLFREVERMQSRGPAVTPHALQSMISVVLEPFDLPFPGHIEFLTPASCVLNRSAVPTKGAMLSASPSDIGKPPR